MRNELSDYECGIIGPMLPNKPRGVPASTTAVYSTVHSGSCDQVRRGAICRRAAAHTRRATIASFDGGGQVFYAARSIDGTQRGGAGGSPVEVIRPQETKAAAAGPIWYVLTRLLCRIDGLEHYRSRVAIGKGRRGAPPLDWS